MINKKVIDKYDINNMYDSLLLFADQIKFALEKKNDILTPKIDSIDSIVICGMGGSAIGGELFKALLSNKIG